jgi:hypothetical protein
MEAKMSKNKLFLLCIAACLLPTIFTIPAFAVEPDEIVGVWLFDKGSGDVAKDFSGNGQDGTIGASVKWDKGKFGGALNFPGTVTNESYVTVPNNESLDLVEHSITAWINVTPTAGDWQIIICKWQPHDVRNYSILTNKGSGTLFAQLTSGGAAQWKTADTGIDVTDGIWHHVACAYDDTMMRVYLDGEKKSEVGMGPGDLNPGDTTIGARWGGIHPTTGLIDEVGLFNVALEEDDIKDIMNRGLAEALGIVAVEPSGKLSTTWASIKE